MYSNPLKQVQGSPAPAPFASVDTSLNPNGGNQQKIAPAVVAAIISAVGALAATGVSAFSTRRSNIRNEDLMREQNQWNLSQWNRENAYNLPTSQMARLKAAGLNPAIMYGNGGIMNEAAGSQPAADAPNIRPELQIDPLTASQIMKNDAETEAIRHNTKREDEKQPITVEQMKANLEQCFAKTDEILQNIKNLKFDEQLKSVEYLRSSIDYQFSTTTFNDAVASLKTGLEAAKLDVNWKKFDLSRAMQLLSYEVVGWDLKNKRERALLNIDWQTYRQTEELFSSVKKKYLWDAENAEHRAYNTAADTKLKNAEVPLKELQFWIDARENKIAYGLYQDYLNGHDINSNFFGKWFVQWSDYWNHGFNLPIKIGFNAK